MLSNEQLKRYSRQIILPGFGAEGQSKLSSANVLVVGAGGLGSTVLFHLAASGVGKIGIVDYDKVEISNLHRQIIHCTSDINKSKVISAAEKIKKNNPDVQVSTYDEKLTESNIKNLFKDFEIIVDGLDNFKDKFLVNDYCCKLNKKLVHAGAVGYEGQIMTVLPERSACLRCIFPDGEPSDFRQSCKEIGVLGVTVGVIGALQAVEVIKLIVGIGDLIENKILKYNALNSKFYELKISGKNPKCSLCDLKSKIHSG
jgi:adenylyltransferase/sulfurtransferase